MRNFSRSRMGRAALESRPTELDPTEASETVVVEGVPEEILELNEASDEVEQTENDVAELGDAIEGLESLYIDVAATMGDRGLTPQSAKFVRHSLEAYTAKLDITIPMPSQEAFGGSSSQSAATRVSLESIKEHIKKIWEWIVNLLESAKRKMIDYFQRVWAEAPRQKKQAEEIISRASAITTAAKESEFDLGSGLANKLAIDGKVGDIKAGLQEIAGMSGKVFTDYVDNATTWATAVTNAVGSLKYGTDDEFTTSMDAVKSVKQVEIPAGLADNAITGDKRFADVEGLKFFASAELLGGRAVIKQIADTPADGASYRDVVDALTKNLIKIDSFKEETTKLEGEQKISTPAASEIKAMCDEVVKIADAVEKFKRNWEPTDKAKSAALTKMKSAKSALGKADKLSPENQQIAGAALKLIGAIPSVMDQPSAGFTKYVLGTNSAVMSLANKALAQYK